MAVVRVYPDVVRALGVVPAGWSNWPAFASLAYLPHRPYFDGLLETYGPDFLGPPGLPGAVEHMAPALWQTLGHADGYAMEQRADQWLHRLEPLLPGSLPDLYLGTLLFIAPAATLSVKGKPAIALGLERFHPQPPPHQPKYWYHPDEVEEMIPHEAAHAARMQALGLPPTPRELSLLDMIMLEGTALTFTDHHLGRETLATFMPPERLTWHRENDSLTRSRMAPDLRASGMPMFRKYFSADSPVSGYYVGYSLCRQFLDQYGQKAVSDLIAMPSEEILHRLR